MKNFALTVTMLGLASLSQADLLHTYRFDNTLEPTAGVFALQPKEGLANPGAFVPSYSTATVGSVTKNVVNIGFNQGFLARFGMVPEAGAEYGNKYTILWDVKFDAFQDGRWASFYNTNASNSNDGDMFLDLTRGYGISGDYAGISSFATGQWHRVVLTVDLYRAGTAQDPRMSVYVDGALVNQIPLGSGVDGRWALYTERLLAGDEFQGTYLLMDESGESANGQLSQVAFWNQELDALAISALGVVGSNIGPSSVTFSDVQVSEGELFVGDLSAIASSDDSSLELFNDPFTLTGKVVLSANVGTDPIISLSTVIESSAARLGLQEAIAFKNQVTGEWDVKAGRVASSYGWMLKGTAQGQAYVASNGDVQVQITWAPINDEDPATDGWVLSLDAARLEIQR